VPHNLLEDLLKEELSTAATEKRRRAFGKRVAVLQIHNVIATFTVTGRCSALVPVPGEDTKIMLLSDPRRYTALGLHRGK
jgi:hypothetical protein